MVAVFGNVTGVLVRENLEVCVTSRKSVWTLQFTGLLERAPDIPKALFCWPLQKRLISHEAFHLVQMERIPLEVFLQFQGLLIDLIAPVALVSFTPHLLKVGLASNVLDIAVITAYASIADRAVELLGA